MAHYIGVRAMEHLQFKVVCEGIADFEILKIISEQLGKLLGTTIDIDLLSPAEDETTRQRERGGWGSVQAWCRGYGSAQPQQVLTSDEVRNLQAAGFDPQLISFNRPKPRWPSLLALTGSAGIIIHLDADIAEKITDQPHPFHASELPRKEYCRRAIASWLGTVETADICFLVATHCTETWFLALHDHTTDPAVISSVITDYESVPNVIPLLLSLGYRDYVDPETRSRTVDKAALTNERGSQLANNFELAMSRCIEIQHLKDYLQQHCMGTQ